MTGKSFQQQKKKAIAGVHASQFQMALFFEPLFKDKAYNEFADIKKYMYWMEKYAISGNVEAQWAIGQAYLGEDYQEVKPNIDMALSYIVKAAKAGNPYAQSYMGSEKFSK